MTRLNVSFGSTLIGLPKFTLDCLLLKLYLYLALYKHSSDADHIINYDNRKVLASDNIKIRLQVKETLLIKELAAYKSLNVNIDSFECKLW